MKFLAFSDLHLHKFPCSNVTEGGDNELLLAGLNIIDQVCAYAKTNKIKTIFFLGDLFHVRSKIDTQIYSNLLYTKLREHFSTGDMSLVMIPGNHDQINKTGEHALLPFSEIRNITVISKMSKHKNVIICPHQYKTEVLYDFLEKNSDTNSIIFMHQLLMNTPLMSGVIFRKSEAIDTTRFKFKTLFSGHNHRPFENKKCGVFNIGSPMHYDFGDAECQKRYFIQYDEGNVKWIETKFPHFATQGTDDEEEATYIRSKRKKVETTQNRIEINFDDDPVSIMSAYAHKENSSLNINELLRVGNSLLNKVA